MPHTNRKKKSVVPATTTTATTTKKPTILHTKRQQLEDDEGWTHIVDTPKPRARASTTSKRGGNGGGLHAGDFEINGVSYVDRTLDEVRADYEFWKKSWEELEACKLLRTKVQIVEPGVEVGEKRADVAIDGQQTEAGETGDAHATDDRAQAQEVSARTPAEDTQGEVKTPAQASSSEKQRRRLPIDNIVVLGLGSLQSARREGRRASATQLAALETIIQTISTDKKNLRITAQDPQFTPLDKEFLRSLGHEVVDDPAAFESITQGSLVYAIHCYAQVYKAVSDGVRPACLVGTDVENFGRYDISETADAIQQSLETMVENCEVIDFPQVRHDFSDTKIYWRGEAVL